MAADVTPAQRARVAAALAYRARQLASAAAAICRTPSPYSSTEPMIQQAIHNALIESALGNARTLAWFFMGHKGVGIWWYGAGFDWNEPLQKVAKEIPKPISIIFGHVTKGPADGHPHPGAWPIYELANTLVPGMAGFVDRDGPAAGHEAWTTESPHLNNSSPDAVVIAAARLLDSLPVHLLPPSDHPDVAKLTHALRSYLQLLPPDAS